MEMANSDTDQILNSLGELDNFTDKSFSFDDYKENSFLNHRDYPIIIGAIAGSVGLILIVLSAILTWYCCQYTMRRNRDAYNLDDNIEKDTKTSIGPGLLNHCESVIFMGIESLTKELPSSANSASNIKRSFSVPLQVNTLEKENLRNELILPLNIARTGKHTNCSFVNTEVSDSDNVAELFKNDIEVAAYTSRSQLYEKNDQEEHFTARSLPWKRSTEDECDVSKSTGNIVKVNFSKRRKNRMRNDSAAAIALNRSGASSTQMPYLHKDTDSLVDNEAVVVYDERTVL